ncbi:uncharacterized protein LOC143788838 [Ranitomeya variabilis]|uniref:uncharacterized protein LOC143788838 n=1 Tax=Ranitomeya variabilis TaxID=490064 RepID=UPI004056062B
MSASQASSLRTRSQTSRSSKSSSKRSVTLARAEAEAAKVRSSFAAQEMQLKLKQVEQEAERARLQAEQEAERARLQADRDAERARLQADRDADTARLRATLERLSAEKEAAAAIAKAEFLEAVEFPESERGSDIRGPDLDHQDPAQRVSEYVRQHSQVEDNSDLLHQPAYTDYQRSFLQTPYWKQESLLRNDIDHHYRPTEQKVRPPPRLKGTPFATERVYTDFPMPEAPTRYEDAPQTPHNNSTPAHVGTDSATMNFARFFTRRELVTKGLVKFTDRAESYRAWRASFQNAIRDLHLSSSEELDLLVKWLGSESAEHAKRIRNINIKYPHTGLRMVWERLEECYGSIEAIENALYKRIDDFPKIANKGYQKLRELSDLLMEVYAAQAEGDLPGLAFLDTARGVNPIVQKLPYNLQEKWVSHGSRYKQAHKVPFPPFRVFVDFVAQQAKVRNDPSFDFTMSCTAASGVKPSKTPVAVHKTNVTSTGFLYRASKSSPEEDKPQDLSKYCPLHKKPHPLLKCRAFREKSLEDRKSFLKENKICFRCCTTTSHFAKNCETSVKCTECSSVEHNTALHPGPPSGVSSRVEESAEKQTDPDVDTPVVTSRCTEICKELVSGRSCSKICLVRITQPI